MVLLLDLKRFPVLMCLGCHRPLSLYAQPPNSCLMPVVPGRKNSLHGLTLLTC